MLKKSSQYYDDNYEDYLHGWSNEHIHYGFWYEDTETHEESLLNTVKETVDYLELQQGDRVLDAGCGTGGASRYIVEHYGVETVGITMSHVLLEAAYRLSPNIKNSTLLHIYFKDYTNTELEDESFNKIFGLESVCYAIKKGFFIKEAFRLLKNGGRLVVVDAFQLKSDLNDTEQKVYQEWLDGWFLPNLAQKEHFYKILKEEGFRNVKYFDKTLLVTIGKEEQPADVRSCKREIAIYIPGDTIR